AALTSLIGEFTDGAVTPLITSVPELMLADSQGGDKLQTYVLFDNNKEVLKWSEQALPGTEVSPALSAFANGGFSAGPDAAYSLAIPGSDRGGDENKLDDVLLKKDDSSGKSVDIQFVWEKAEFNFSAGGLADSNSTIDEVLQDYVSLMQRDWSGLDLNGQNLDGRNLSLTDFTNSNLSSSSLQGANFSESFFFEVDLSEADLTGADLRNTVMVRLFGSGSLDGADLTDANLEGAWSSGTFDLSTATLSNTTCPDGTNSDETNCASGFSEIPPPLVGQFFLTNSVVRIDITPFIHEMYYMGVHEYVPGVNAPTIESSLIIGESSWRSFIGDDAVNNYTSTDWIVRVNGLSGEQLESLGSKLQADARVSSVVDWSSTHKDVERNGGLIFGTPGLLSLQFVVASVAAVASSFVFLSLVLSQRQKELAVLQAIGASPNQIIRLVLFEILSIVMVSMILGIILGVGVALSFNGFFDIFGFIFQIFGGSSTTINRTLVYPWTQIILVSLAVFAAVVVALLVTTRRALKADLASVLKGE
ncbi:MAG: pentapeptide repeat-containing protein, partial [Candidatus Poseidonia sp.]|nr:pentapeptide repeat-containing protein [Poseidonia sp.]